MSYSITRAAVVGAGIMGAGIAAHLANVGIPVTLLDIVPPDAPESSDPEKRNAIAAVGLERALKAKPASAFYTARSARLVTIGNTEDDFGLLTEADWIVEAVIEQADVKQQLFGRLEGVRKPGSIVSSNTSGLPAQMLLEGRGEDFQRHFLITHFFNPVRFMKLLELVAGPATDPELMRFMGEFCTNRLGKGVVYCKDRPNFIGNRIGMCGFAATVHRMLDEGYKIEEVDAITGQAIGHPKSATFRTADLAGIDTSLHVADNLYENLPDDPQRELFKMPQFIRDMVARGWVGDKSRQGFYKRTPAGSARNESPAETERSEREGRTGGKRDILVIDPATLEYREQDSVHFSSLDSVKENPNADERVRS